MLTAQFIKCILIVGFCQLSHGLGLTEGEASEIHNERLSQLGEEKRTTVYATEGDYVSLVCEFTPRPAMSIEWYKRQDRAEGAVVELISDNSINRMEKNNANESVTVSEVILISATQNDRGNYSCTSRSAFEISDLVFNVIVEAASPCKRNPCGQNGVCSPSEDSFSCICNPGYIGENCERLDQCSPQPCRNNGTCTRTKQGFDCYCPPGYTGTFCELKACLKDTCNQAGTCQHATTEDGDVTCECYYRYGGQFCQVRCRFSYPYCRNGITCVKNEGGEDCSCHEYDTELYCVPKEEVKDECDNPYACNRHGICKDETYKFRCLCRPGASGNQCENIEECAPRDKPCWEHEGICVGESDGFKCRCPTEEGAERCQQSPNACRVACKDDHMLVSCNMDSLNRRLQILPVKTNPGKSQCVFRNGSRVLQDELEEHLPRREGIFHVRINYTDCETEFELKDDVAIYRNSLRAGLHDVAENGNDVITRIAGTFLFNMECKLPLKLDEASVGIESISLHNDQTTEEKEEENILLLTKIAFYDKDWTSATNYEVGQRLYVKLELAKPTENQRFSNMILKPANCYATPGDHVQHPRHELLRDGCIEDDTFRFEDEIHANFSSDVPRSYFSFDSFSFIGNHGDKLYLHCDAVCTNLAEGQEDIGKCKRSSEVFAEAEHYDTSTTATRRKRDAKFARDTMAVFPSVVDRVSSGSIKLISSA